MTAALAFASAACFIALAKLSISLSQLFLCLFVILRIAFITFANYFWRMFADSFNKVMRYKELSLISLLFGLCLTAAAQSNFNQDYLDQINSRFAAFEEQRDAEFKAYIIRGGKAEEITLGMAPLTEDEKNIILAGCLMNYWKN